MTVYPQAIDDDRSIIRIDDNISELGTLAINQLRSAIFSIEKELGTLPSGSKSSLDERISVSLNNDGTLRTEAIEAAGFIALPIVDKYIANNASIKEYKLDLNVSTLDLQAQINAVDIVANNTASLAAETNADLLNHLAGVQYLTDGITRARHYDNQIDLSFTLYDNNGNSRSAIQVEQALYQINQALINHQNTIYDAHSATAITVITNNWNELPADAENLQEVLDFIDNQETLSTGVDRATLHSNGIPRNARVQRIDLDGYNYEIIPETKCRAFLAEPNQTSPRDSITNGDDVISFVPDDNSGYSFDSKFTQVQVGDILRINYRNGISGEFRISSVRITPGLEWTVRINGWNLINRDGGTVDGYAYARIDRRRHDINTKGILAVAGAHADVVPDGACSTNLDGIIVASPRGASAIGIGFDPGAFNEKHYNLWLRLYPTGKPDVYNDLYPIDVTGNQGITPGAYSLESIVENTNKAFRAAGNNYRFISFSHNGEFGIMLADSWRNAAFSIIAGSISSGAVEEGIYTKNVIGDSTDGYDALGFGANKAVVASPVSSSYNSGIEAANLPTIIHSPAKGFDYLSNGTRRDFLRTKNYTEGDGYWNATIVSNFSDIPNGTITTTYRINNLLLSEGLSPGKTIVVQSVNSSDVSIVGYGRFIIGDVLYNEVTNTTDILVINSVHTGGSPMGGILPEATNVLIYFTNDSVGFNVSNLSEQGTFHRYHEIFVDQNGKTFSVERARVEKQSADSKKINTNRSNWQIRNVSSKLKGYRLDDDFRFWIRFVITEYNNTTGEFDGYIGSPPNIGAGWDTHTGIIKNGPITKGFKNKAVRFYDETYINFIDIEFRELSLTPGTIIATDTPQYIDIEIFPTLANDHEVMRIAGVSHNEIVVGSITDLRNFGNVSEENFTDSAIKFVESGERYLHTNGVIRGFEYTGTGINSSVLQISGGMGLIDGSFVAMDAMDVVIPEMRSNSSLLNVFICATKNGTMRIIPENVGSQFFQTLTGEFVESYSFQEIINHHKDLLILYVANITVDAGTISDPSSGYVVLNSVIDARKFSLNESSNITFSISNDPEISSFTSFDQIITWANKITADKIYIKIKGNIEINSAIDLSGISAKIIFEDDGGIITVNSPIGFIVNHGVEFRNLKIIYNNIIDNFNSNDLSHLSSGYSCIKFTSGSYKCKIENCEFSQTISGERYPFIGIYSDLSFPVTIEELYFNGNFFHETSNSYNCAIGFYQTGSYPNTSHLLTTLRNITINNNVIEGYQSILITGQDDTFKTENVEICNNNSTELSDVYGSKFVIGVSARRTNVVIGGPSEEEYTKGIRICNNNCLAIYPAGYDGKYLGSIVSSAKAIITGNECYQITSYLSNYGGVNFIENNIINYPEERVTQLGNLGISTSTSLSIIGNGAFEIHKNYIYVSTNGIGIKINSGYGHICHNTLVKNDSSIIAAFIDTTSATDNSINITDNNLSTYVSAPFTGGSTYILKHNSNQLVDRNINDITSMSVPLTIGEVGSYHTQSINHKGIINLSHSADFTSLYKDFSGMIINLSSSNVDTGYVWYIPLIDILPQASKISNFSYTALWYSSGGTMASVRTQAILFRGGPSSTVLFDTGTITLPIESTEYSVSLDCGKSYIQDAYLYIRIWRNDGGGSSDAGQLEIRNPIIEYLY